MRFTKEKSDAIKKYILEQISENTANIPQKVADTFTIAPSSVYRYLRTMESEGIIVKRNGHYALPCTVKRYRFRKDAGEHLDEYDIYVKTLLPIIKDLPSNILEIWSYSFSEMMNNAGDHAQATTINLYIYRDYMNTNVMIVDNGIGIFKKIKEHFGYPTLEDAITELFKGKLTTDSENHSGEGIFFTSRILDNFAAISDNQLFSHSKYEEIMTDVDDLPDLKNTNHFKTGTIIFMKLSNFSHKNIKDVFDQFADPDGGFHKTRIPLKNIYETYPVSRSQAKRLVRRFERFKEVELDFSEIKDIGQAFADELFRVFAAAHPDITLIPVNANKQIQKMIHHVSQ